VNQSFIDYLKEKFKTTQFFQLKLNGKMFVSFFDTGVVTPEFIKLCQKKFNCDVLLVVNTKNKEVVVYKSEISDVNINDFNKKVFNKGSGHIFSFTKEFLGLTKHFKPC